MCSFSDNKMFILKIIIFYNVPTIFQKIYKTDVILELVFIIFGSFLHNIY